MSACSSKIYGISGCFLSSNVCMCMICSVHSKKLSSCESSKACFWLAQAFAVVTIHLLKQCLVSLVAVQVVY